MLRTTPAAPAAMDGFGALGAMRQLKMIEDGNNPVSQCGWNNGQPTHFPPRPFPDSLNVLTIVPGVADAKRARMTVANIDHLRPRGCIVFTHKKCGENADLDAMLDAGPNPPLAKRCEVYRAPNGPKGGYVQHLKRVLPTLVEGLRYEWVFVLLDDINATRLSLSHLLKVAIHNKLSWASPAVDGAHDDVAKPRNTSELSRLGAPSTAIGRVVHRIESFTWLMTPPMYRCLHTLIDPALNGVGWGYDHWLYLYCSKWPPVDFKAGIVDSMVVVHGLTPEPSSSSTSSAAAAATSATDDAASRSAAVLAHTYGRKEAQEAVKMMQEDMAKRGMGKMRMTDKWVHGWLVEPGVPIPPPPEPKGGGGGGGKGGGKAKGHGSGGGAAGGVRLARNEKGRRRLRANITST